MKILKIYLKRFIVSNGIISKRIQELGKMKMGEMTANEYSEYNYLLKKYQKNEKRRYRFN